MSPKDSAVPVEARSVAQPVSSAAGGSRPATAGPAKAAKPAASRRLGPIVPASSVSGSALVMVIAIMTYLASLTIGGVDLVRTTANDWARDVLRETTIQISPAEGRDIDVAMNRAVELARGTPGVVDVRPYSKQETARLLEPWLGSGLALDELPIPRLIVLKLSADAPFDADGLKASLAREAPGAVLDDHRRFLDRLVSMARTIVWLGVMILGLMLAATVLSVVFATRGAMASNRDIVQVLHYVGARDGYIAAQFQRRFLMLGLKGGIAGGVIAIATFLLAEFAAGQRVGSAAGDQMEALFGNFRVSPTAYAGVIGVVLLIAALTAATSRLTVYRTLRLMN